MATFEQQLIEAVRGKREAQGLSIRALASLVGISFSTLARVERGEGQPDNNSRIRLMEWLGDDARTAGLSFDKVALVHFRAMKNIRSSTVSSLLRAAEDLVSAVGHVETRSISTSPAQEASVGHSKEELEDIASRFRADLSLSPDSPLDPLRLTIDGIDTVGIIRATALDGRTKHYLSVDACSEWSAMSVPVGVGGDRWIVLLNDCHAVERQRVTILEEYWHILLGHRLTRVARIAESYGRTYDKVEEHDAYYLASATLLPRAAVIAAVAERRPSALIAGRFGTSSDLVDYRIKRLGLWREHSGRAVSLS